MSLTSLSAFLLMLVVFVVAQDQFTSVAVPTFLKVTATARVTWWTPSAIVGEIVLPIWTEMGFVMMVMSVLARQMSVAFAMVQVRFMIVAVREFQLWHAIASEILILIQTGCVTRKMTVSVNSMQQGFAMEAVKLTRMVMAFVMTMVVMSASATWMCVVYAMVQDLSTSVVVHQ